MLDFNDNPRMTTHELQEEVKRVVGQINEGKLFNVITGVSLSAGENPIAHGIMGHVPKTASVVPHVAGMDPRRSRDPDTRCVYYTVSVAGSADVVVFF